MVYTSNTPCGEICTWSLTIIRVRLDALSSSIKPPTHAKSGDITIVAEPKSLSNTNACTHLEQSIGKYFWGYLGEAVGSIARHIWTVSYVQSL
jgi:hypothetical protein